MAKPTTFNPSKLALFIGDDSTPENFNAPCGLNAKTFTVTGKAGETITYDCDDPDLPGWVERALQSRDWSVQGTGVLALEAFPTWRSFGMELADSRDIRLGVDTDNTGYFEGRALCTNFQIKGDQTSGQKVSVDITISGDGAITWVDT